VREKERLKVRQPLPAVLVDGRYREQVGGMEDLVMEELNIREVRFAEDASAYMDYVLKPNFKAAGPVFGPKVKAFAAALAGLSGGDAVKFVAALEGGAGAGAALRVDGEEVNVTADLVDVKVSAKEGFAVGMEGGLFVILDTTLTPALVQEGLAREFVSKVQQMRKSAGLEMMDRIEIGYSEEGGSEIARMAGEYAAYIKKETLADALGSITADMTAVQDVDLNGRAARIGIRKV